MRTIRIVNSALRHSTAVCGVMVNKALVTLCAELNRVATTTRNKG